MSKRLGGIIKAAKDKTSSWHLNGFPDGSKHWVNSIMSGRSPSLYCYIHLLTLIAMQGHLTKQNKSNVCIVHNLIG